jgi:hypothetical protein
MVALAAACALPVAVASAAQAPSPGAYHGTADKAFSIGLPPCMHNEGEGMFKVTNGKLRPGDGCGASPTKIIFPSDPVFAADGLGQCGIGNVAVADKSISLKNGQIDYKAKEPIGVRPEFDKRPLVIVHGERKSATKIKGYTRIKSNKGNCDRKARWTMYKAS